MLIFQKEVEEDIKVAHEWYEERQKGLGRAFIDEVETTIETVEKNPELYAQAHKNIRRALCRRFPYSLYYIISGSDIIVIGLLHQRRNPAMWRKRG